MPNWVALDQASPQEQDHAMAKPAQQFCQALCKTLQQIMADVFLGATGCGMDSNILFIYHV